MIMTIHPLNIKRTETKIYINLGIFPSIVYVVYINLHRSVSAKEVRRRTISAELSPFTPYLTVPGYSRYTRIA